jgi:hypothetical protein
MKDVFVGGAYGNATSRRSTQRERARELANVEGLASTVQPNLDNIRDYFGQKAREAGA